MVMVISNFNLFSSKSANYEEQLTTSNQKIGIPVVIQSIKFELSIYLLPKMEMKNISLSFLTLPFPNTWLLKTFNLHGLHNLECFSFIIKDGSI